MDFAFVGPTPRASPIDQQLHHARNSRSLDWVRSLGDLTSLGMTIIK